MTGFNAESFERWQRHSALWLRVLVCMLFSTFVIWMMGPIGILLAAVLCALCFSIYVPALFSSFRHGVRWQHYRAFDGRYYAYKGSRIRVFEPVAGERWLALDDLNRVLDEPLREQAQQLAPAGSLQMHEGLLCISAPACLEQLALRRSDRASRLRRWVEQVVWLPSGQARREKDRRAARSADVTH